MRDSVRSFFTAVFLIGAVVTAAPAIAEETIGQDEVTLKSGGSVRGTIVSVEPGDKVVIVELGAKEPRTIVWAEVADVEKGKYAEKTKDGAVDSGAVEPGSAGPGYDDPHDDEDEKPKKKKKKKKKKRQPKAVVHIESGEPVTLYERGSREAVANSRGQRVAMSGDPVCASPCDVELEVGGGDRYFIAGDGIPESRQFRLDRYEPEREGAASEVTIQVSPGNTGLKVGGIVMMSLGGAAFGAGAALFLVSSFKESQSGKQPYLIGGGVGLGVGVGLLVGGLVAFVKGGTSVDIRNNASDKKASSGSKEEAFHLDSRPVAVEPNYWIGQF